jgi:TetR/AcrR family transcriptional regulator, tetracycline repressor protein
MMKWRETEGDTDMDRETDLGDADARAPDRPTLSRERIVVTAIEFVDEHGLTALTMRRLGRELGVEAMSLYRYVNGREDLLEGMVDRMVGQLHPHPDGEELGPADGWQAYLQWLAHGVRALARAHPHVFPLIASRHPAAPWLRPPLRSLEIVEDFLDTLISRGFSDGRAVDAYRAFSSFLLGHLLLEVSLLGAQTAPAEEPLDEGDSDVPNADQQIDLTTFPQIQRLEPQLSEDHADPEFERALEDLLDRLDREITE